MVLFLLNSKCKKFHSQKKEEEEEKVEIEREIRNEF
jgi:hypothetical protein